MKLIVLILVVLSVAFALPHKPEERIIGGEISDIKNAGFVVSVRYTAFLCNAALVGNRVAVTTAKCLLNKYTKLLSIRAGSTDLGKGGVTIDVKVYHLHPQFNKKTFENDIAMIQLVDGVFDEAPLAVPAKLANYDIHSQDKLTLYSFGAPEAWQPSMPSSKIKALQTEVVEPYACGILLKRPISKTTMGCTYSKNNGICQGDEGASLVNPKDGMLVGLASFHIDECAPSKRLPDVYTNINPYRKWIKSYIKKWDY